MSAFITGIGIISPIGCDCATVLKSLRQKRDGIGTATKIDASKFHSQICGEVRDFDCASNMSPSELETYTDPFIRFAINAGRMAVRDAGFDKLPKSTAIVVASCNAGMNSGEKEYIRKFENSAEPFNRSISTQSEFYALCKAMAHTMQVSGECYMVNTACSGSTAGIGLGQWLIDSGQYDCVIVGGSDAMSLANYAGFSAIKVVSDEKIAPFSTPIGMNIGEGSAFWILENESVARKRNARVYGKVIAHATTGDAHHPTQPDPRGDGAYRTMRNVLQNAGVNLESIGCINAHGSGTSANDKAESKGIAKFLAGTKVPITSTKSYTGHCMGATGIIEATCQLLSMNDDFIPPTLRNVGARAGCEIEAVAGDGIDGKYDCFLSANYAFAGNNAGIIVAKENFEDYKKVSVQKNQRIVITGAGTITSLGLGFDENLVRLANGESGIKKIERFETERYAGLVELPNLRAFDRRLDFSGMNLISTYATIATKSAFDDASVRMRRDISEDVGIAVSTCRGSSETAHMEGVFANEDRRGDIACFSNVTANSTAGWVSKALEIKGANITLASGQNSGLQTLAYASDIARSGEAKISLAVSADELYKQMIDSYEEIGNLHIGAVERDFHLNYSSYYKGVLGEGAVAVVVETMDNAVARGAKILGEVLAYSSTMDCVDFLEPNLTGVGLEQAVRNVLESAKLSSSDIDLVIWSPRGCAHDAPAILVRDKVLGKIPMLTTSLHTGYIETGSILHSLMCALKSFEKGLPLWKQRTGLASFDDLPLPENPKKILCLASSHMGNNYAMIIGRD